MNDAETLAAIRELDAADLPPADRADVTALKRDRRALLALLDAEAARHRDLTDRYREALRDLTDIVPIDTDGETLDQWCHYCDSLRADMGEHKPSCVWAEARRVLAETERSEE